MFNYVDFHIYSDLLHSSEADPENKVAQAETLFGYEKTNTFLDFDINVTHGNYFVNLRLAKQIKGGLSLEKVAGIYSMLLNSFIENQEKQLKDLNTLSPSAQNILLGYNSTAHALGIGETLVSRFRGIAKENGGSVAVIHKGKHYSYEYLDKASDGMSVYLRSEYGIGIEDLVMVQQPRSVEMLVSLLGILKSGAAYVPVDPDYPLERVEYIRKDSGSKVILDEQEYKRYERYEGIDVSWGDEVFIDSRNLAYVIYTSGSTGEPKGCMLEHQGVINRIEWMWQSYGYSREDIILQKTNYSFDVSVWELFMPLCWGCKMVLSENSDSRSEERILDLIESHKVSCLHFVPSVLNNFLEELQDHDLGSRCSSLRLVIASGEALSPQTVRHWYSRLSVPLYNLYGPTEASIDVTHYQTHDNDDRIPIGKPIWNTELLILNDYNQYQPLGVTGEICIAGIGLARGYLNKAELSSSKFIAHPFKPGEKLYKTGDLGRWLADGNIEYLGRKDDQLKIRGFRIEPGEIEKHLNTHEKIKQSVVIGHEMGNGKELVCYLVSKGSVTGSELRNYLGDKLPSYMIPGYYVEMDSIPLNANGKTDRKKLPSPLEKSLESGIEYMAPSTETEKKLARIWGELLHIDKDKISTKDDFFNLGGHSLQATRLQSRIHKEFQIKVDFNDLFIRSLFNEQIKLIDKELYDYELLVKKIKRDSKTVI
jgi:tyrocidine synthetase III